MPPVRLRVVPNAPRAASREEDWEALVHGVIAGRASDERRLVELIAPFIDRVLLRVLGTPNELADLSQEVLIRVFDRLEDLRDASAFRGFVASITVFVAREAIRARRRRRWLFFLPPEKLPEPSFPECEPAVREALASFYEVLGRLPVDERIAFCLRYVEEMEILEIADATGASSSTVKRRLKSAEARFSKIARRMPELMWLLPEGSTWPATR